MTNVMFGEKFRQMVEHKQKQSRDNLELILAPLDEINRPVSSNEIEEHLHKTSLQRAKGDAQHKYESGEIGRGDIDKYIRKNNKRISLRTVQRTLKTCVTYGSVQKEY